MCSEPLIFQFQITAKFYKLSVNESSGGIDLARFGTDVLFFRIRLYRFGASRYHHELVLDESFLKIAVS